MSESRIWLRWTAAHGLPRAVLKLRARRGDPMAQLLLGRADRAERLRLIEDIRQRGPLVRTPAVWVSADHGVCRQVLRSSDFGIADPNETGLPDRLRGVLRRLDPGLPNPVEPPSMLMTDPPEHTEFRRLVARSFTPRSITTLESRITDLTCALLDELAGRDVVDLVADYAAQLPAAVITEILGVPAQDRGRILGWGTSVAPLLDIGIAWPVYRTAVEELRDVDDYLGAHFQLLHRHGGDGTPFSAMATEGGLSARELRSNAALLVGAGVETTVNLIGNGVATLLDHPEQLALLAEDPGRWPAAVEEILRFASPVQMTARKAHRDSDIDGVTIGAGEVVVMLLGGANRDPAVFDHPDRFDITRSNAREHLAFATGIHVCLGAALARIEAAAALRGLFERYPDLRLAGPARPRSLVNLHGFASMPATVTRQTAGRGSAVR
ncbi:MAG: cytochrome P450 [Actinomycetota bacterium]|nr:cytochrome P450 [Actinomycetota bacterium]